MTDIAALRDAHRAQKAALLATLGERAAPTRTVRNSLRRMSDLVDSMLVQLWQLSGMGEPYALLAVGGFGRCELFPYSDVDVLVLLPDGSSAEDDADLKGRIEAFISFHRYFPILFLKEFFSKQHLHKDAQKYLI